MLSRTLVSCLAAVSCWLGSGVAAAAAGVPGPSGSTVVASYAADRRLPDADPVTGFDAGYGVVAWSSYAHRDGGSSSQAYVRLASGAVKALDRGDVIAVIRVDDAAGVPGVRVVVQRCAHSVCDRMALDPVTGNALPTHDPWLEQLIGDGGSATDGASSVQDGVALTVQPATPGASTCGVTAFNLSDTLRVADIPSIAECRAPAWVQQRGTLIVARTSMPTLTPKHYRWQSVMLDTAAPAPTWTRIATATQGPGGGTFIKREAIGAGTITLLREPFQAITKAGVTIDSAPRSLVQVTVPTPAPYAPAVDPTPAPLPFVTTKRSPLIAVRSDGAHRFVLRAKVASKSGSTAPGRFQILQLPD